MAIWTEEISSPSLIPNTIMVKRYADGVHKTYRFTPVDGYVLHDNEADGRDWEDNIIPRYSSGMCSCGASYDFSTTEMTVPDINGNNVVVTAYGSRQFFAFPENLVPDPENNIYGGSNNNHEAM